MSQTKIKNKTIHTPVLLQEVLDTIRPAEGERYLDLTAGYGGHTKEILARTQAEAVLVDRDEHAVAALHELFDEQEKVTIVHDDFLSASKALVQTNQTFDIVLADLGVSSPHLDNASRGFSLLGDGPLDMRMDPSQSLTAAEVVNTYSADDLERILRDYGEEPKAKRMAQLIIEARPLQTTNELAMVAKKVWPGHSRTHPATRLFQAVRIEVNNELGLLKQALPLWVRLLAPHGRLGVISFHSLEDRIVKQFLTNRQGDRYDAELVAVTTKPLQATKHELAINPRARSAKIRVSKRK